MSIPVKLRPIPLSAHWPEEALVKRYHVNPRSFDRGFRLKSYTSDELTFPSFQSCRTPGLVLGDLQRNTNWPAVIGVDLSSKKRGGNAIVGVRVDPDRRYRYPVFCRFLAKPGPEVCDAIQEADDLLNPVVIMVEDNGYQDSIFDWIGDQKARFRFWVKVQPCTTTSGRKGDAERGLPGLEVEFKNQAWKFPYSEYEGTIPEAASEDQEGPSRTPEEAYRAAWARLDREFSSYPIAASSDGVMATWFARQGIESFVGLGTGGGSDLGDLNRR